MTAFAALILAALALGYAWRANRKADEALDAATLANFQPDAILLMEDGEEAELRFDRSN